MNKREIVQKISYKIPYEQEDIGAIVNGFIETLQEECRALKHNESITIMGFLRFKKRCLPPRPGRNPMTKEEYTIPAMNKIYVTPTKMFSKYIKGETK